MGGIHSILAHPHAPIGIRYHFLHAGRQPPYSIVLLILMHMILLGFYSRSELGAVFCHPWFPCEGPFYVFLLCVCCPYQFVANVYVFPLPSWEPGFPLPSLDCVIFPSGSIVENKFLFSHVGWLCLPLHFGAIVGFFGVILAMIGPRTTQELFSISKLWIACLTACMQWLVFGLCRKQGWGIGLLDKLGVFGKHTNRARGLDFFSTTPK